MKITAFSILNILILSCFFASPSFANIDQMKYYREINPDLKPNCMYCHMDKAPKKEKGKHDLNPYGAKMQESFEAQKTEGMTKEQVKEAYIKIFKELGRHDTFNAEAAPKGQ
ncbi:MAG: hypothetical protein KBD53_09895 [Candidatus Omnitrophica bacterium]|nr:hypothetical protein [Candidatus Omnitrophota bacterium]